MSGQRHVGVGTWTWTDTKHHGSHSGSRTGFPPQKARQVARKPRLYDNVKFQCQNCYPSFKLGKFRCKAAQASSRRCHRRERSVPMSTTPANFLKPVTELTDQAGKAILGIFTGGMSGRGIGSVATPPVSPEKKAGLFVVAPVDVDAEFKRPFSGSPHQATRGEEDAEDYNEFNFWRQGSKRVSVEESYNSYNYWKMPGPTLDELESQAPASPSKAPAHLLIH